MKRPLAQDNQMSNFRAHIQLVRITCTRLPREARGTCSPSPETASEGDYFQMLHMFAFLYSPFGSHDAMLTLIMLKSDSDMHMQRFLLGPFHRVTMTTFASMPIAAGCRWLSNCEHIICSPRSATLRTDTLDRGFVTRASIQLRTWFSDLEARPSKCSFLLGDVNIKLLAIGMEQDT
jgi:hypothetical protein